MKAIQGWKTRYRTRPDVDDNGTEGGEYNRHKNAIRIIRRFWWWGLRTIGFAKYSWDMQYKAGVWERDPISPHTIKNVSGLCAGGKLVQFGCGEGRFPFQLPHECFSEYIGYDISEVAIKRARDRAIFTGVNCIRFEQYDMKDWLGTEGVSVILLQECLYYLSPSEVEKFLKTCMTSLTPTGLIYVVDHSPAKHAAILAECRHSCRLVDETLIGERLHMVLAPRGRPSDPSREFRFQPPGSC